MGTDPGEIRRFPPRAAAVAGMFYDGAKDRLRKQIESYYKNRTSRPVDETIIGLVAPHAGYVYSGYVAAEAYGHLQNRCYDVVVLIGPSHRDAFRGASVYIGDYQTPLGTVPVCESLARQLVGLSQVIQASELGHREEHALEVQLPFLQVALADFEVIPVTMGTQDWSTCLELGTHLATVLKGRRALVVASSDLSHYHSDDEARRLDARVVEDVGSFDAEKLYRDIQARSCEACGAGPIMAAMMAAKRLGASRASVVSYHTSGEVNQDYGEVVGYLAGLFYN